jgi:hypothetical protein
MIQQWIADWQTQLQACVCQHCNNNEHLYDKILMPEISLIKRPLQDHQPPVSSRWHSSVTESPVFPQQTLSLPTKIEFYPTGVLPGY